MLFRRVRRVRRVCKVQRENLGQQDPEVIPVPQARARPDILAPLAPKERWVLRGHRAGMERLDQMDRNV